MNLPVEHVDVNLIKDEEYLIEILRKRNFDINVLIDVSFSSVNILTYAIQKNYYKLSYILLSHGADLSSSLFYYIRKGMIEETQYLIDLKFDLNIPNSRGLTPIGVASTRNNPEMVELLLKNGANPNNSGKYIPLILACARGLTENIEILLRYGADPNKKSKITVMETALQISSIKSVQLLLEYGAFVDQNMIDKIESFINRFFVPGEGTKLWEKVKEIVLNFPGTKNLKRMCLDILEKQNFSLDNLPESFYK